MVELDGHVAPRPERPRFLGLPIPPPGFDHRPSLPDLTATFDALARAPWLEGVLLRIEAFQADPATVFALRRAVVALRAAGKRTLAYLTQLDWTGYSPTSATSFRTRSASTHRLSWVSPSTRTLNPPWSAAATIRRAETHDTSCSADGPP